MRLVGPELHRCAGSADRAGRELQSAVRRSRNEAAQWRSRNKAAQWRSRNQAAQRDRSRIRRRARSASRPPAARSASAPSAWRSIAGCGLRAAVSTGNEADVSALEVLTALARDPECGALLGYAESLSDADGLRALAAAAAEHGKPVALLVGGVSEAGARAAASHTGALATGERVVDGVLRQFGIVRVDDVDELLDVGRRVRADRAVPSATGSRSSPRPGGSGILATDAIARHRPAPGRRSRRRPAPSWPQIVPAVRFGGQPGGRDRDRDERPLRWSAVRSTRSPPTPAWTSLVVCFCVLVGADVDAIVDALAEVRQRLRQADPGGSHRGRAPRTAGHGRAAGGRRAQLSDAGPRGPGGRRRCTAAGRGRGSRPRLTVSLHELRAAARRS